MKARAVWNLSVSPDIPKRMGVVKAVLGMSSYNNLLEYFLTAAEHQFKEKITCYNEALGNSENSLALKEPDSNPLF